MSTLNTQIYEQASEWLILHRCGDLEFEAKRRFDAWLRESPQHASAYLEMSTIWEDVPALNRGWNPNADELIMRACAEGNVVPLGIEKVQGTSPFIPPEDVPSGRSSSGTEIHLDGHPQRSRVVLEPRLRSGQIVTVPASEPTGIKKLLAIAALLTVCVVGTAWLLYAQRGLYRTGVGEQLTVALTDGSTIQLNSQSKLRVHYTDQERSIDLIQGQALFKVTKDPNRPFIVDSNGTRVRAVGTQFDVYKRNIGTQITVVEGRVSVALAPLRSEEGKSEGTLQPSAAGDLAGEDSEQARMTDPSASSALHRIETQLGEVLVSAGEQILIAQATPELAPELGTVPTTPNAAALPSAGAVLPVAANVEAVTAWTQQRLVFDFTPLSEVAAEFNRYNRRSLVVEDPALATFNISGSFSSTDPTLLLRFLREQPGIVVTETNSEIRISSADTHG